MKFTAKISVVMATWNGEQFIKEQLDSILTQTYDNLEIICVDDQSSDSTIAILQKYSEKHPSVVQVIAQTVNTGSRTAFSNGCAAATGEFIAFADQDDWWLPSKLEVLFDELIKDENLAFVYSNSELVDENLKQIQPKTFTDSTNFINGKNYYRLINDNTIMGCSMLLRADFVKKCLPFPSKGFHHDWYLAIMALGYDYAVKYIDQVLFKYRRHSSNQVNKVRKKHSQNKTRFRALRTYLENSLVDSSNFTNQKFKEIFEAKKRLFHHILHKEPVKAFFAWRKFYQLLETVDCLNPKIKKSNLRYIVYSLGWTKITDSEKK